MAHTSPFHYSLLDFKQKVYNLFTGPALTEILVSHELYK
jgi:hypothetical protein